MKETITWDQVEAYINNVACKIDRSKYSGIFTFPRGGLVLATLLSYKLDLPILMAPCDHCIIIDDICDLGITMKKYSDLKDKKDYFITTFYVHESQLDESAEYLCNVDYYERIKYDLWVEFPWEIV